jgi:hypothetical protein
MFFSTSCIKTIAIDAVNERVTTYNVSALNIKPSGPYIGCRHYLPSHLSTILKLTYCNIAHHAVCSDRIFRLAGSKCAG